MKAIKSLLVLMFSFAVMPATSFAITADDIVEKANQAAYYTGKDGRSDVKMEIVDSQGGTRERRFSIIRLTTEGADQKFYVYFKEPSDVRKMAFLVWKNTAEGKDDDRWMYLPALNLVRRIAPGDKRTSFVGSDFFYEDVSGRSLKADRHELVSEDENSWLVKNTPVNPGEVEFAWYNVRIGKKNFLPIKAEYYDKNEKLYRQVEALEVKEISGHPTVLRSKASDLLAGSHTVNTFENVEYDIGLKDNIFTERFLRRPPREVTK